MSRSPIIKFLSPWSYKREEQKRRFEALRQRDGDNCRRCRRPMCFDLPVGRDQAPAIEPIVPGVSGSGTSALDNLCLCHVRCNADAGDATPEVLERLRSKTAVEPKRPRRKRAA